MDRGALVLLAANVLALLAGFAVAWTARRRPRTVVALIGVAVAAGAGAMWSAAAVVDAAGPQAGWVCLAAGMLVVALGCPACVLVVIARQRRGTAVGPAGVGEWAGMLAGYWFFCWVLVIIGSFVIHLGGTPHGQFR